MGTQGRTKPCLHSVVILFSVLLLWAFWLNAATGDTFCPPAQPNAAYNITAERYDLGDVSEIDVRATWSLGSTAIAVCNLSTRHCNESTLVKYANHYEIRRIGDKGIQAWIGVDRFVPLLERTFAIAWEIGEKVVNEYCPVAIGNPINECDQFSPCVNATRCSDWLIGYKCHCLPGFSGIKCNAVSSTDNLHCKPNISREGSTVVMCQWKRRDHQLRCGRSEYKLYFSKGGGKCKSFNNNCSIAGLDSRTRLDLGSFLTDNNSQLQYLFSISNNTLSFTVCTLNSTQNGEHKITYQIHSMHSKTSYQVQIVVEVVENNTAPVFNSPFNGDPYVFNITEGFRMRKDRIVTVTKSMSRSCDHNSCIEVMDHDESSLVLEVTVENIRGQPEKGSGSWEGTTVKGGDGASEDYHYVLTERELEFAPVQYEEEDAINAFGYFYLLGENKPGTSITYSLKVTDGDNATASAKVVFNVLDVNDPPVCSEGPVIIKIYLQTHKDSDHTSWLCFDGDVHPLFQKIDYTITGDHSNYFRIVEIDGHIVLSRALWDLDPGIRNLTITATGYSAEQDDNYIAHIPVIVHFIADRCPRHFYESWGVWIFEETPVGSEVTIRCHGMHTGYITRSCYLNQTWGPLNNNCSNEELGNINTALEHFTDRKDNLTSAEIVEKIMAVAVDLTSAINENIRVLPTDIIQTVEILTIVQNLTNLKDTGLDRNTVQKFVSTADVLFDANVETWNVANEDYEGGAKMMQALDSIVSAGLRDDQPVEAALFVRNHLELTTSVSRDDIVYTNNRRTDENGSNMTIQIATSAFLSKNAFKNTQDAVKYSVVLYKNLTDKLQINPKLQSGQLRGKRINSDVLAFVINVTLTTLLSPLQLNFSVLQAKHNQPSCGFLDTSARVAGVWSTEGCTTIDLGDTVQCSCDHLTNFGVLMNPYGDDMSSDHEDALSIISAVGCGISMFCLVITIIAYLCLWKYVKGDRSVLHINLSVCLVAAYIVFLVGVDRTDDQVGCKVVAALLHYLFLAVFFIMLSEGIEVFKSVSFVFSSGSILCKLILLSYGVPLIIVAVSLGVTKTEGYGSHTSCWLSTKGGLIWAFVGPVLLVILINFVILIQVLRIMQRTRVMIDKPAQEKAKSVVRTIFILSPLLGVTWVFGVLSVNKDAIVFQYLFAIFNSLQGLFIFICYCLLTPHVRDGFREMRRKHRARSFDSGQKMVSSSSSPGKYVPPRKSSKKASKKSHSINNVQTSTQESSLSETRCDIDS